MNRPLHLLYLLIIFSTPLFGQDDPMDMLGEDESEVGREPVIATFKTTRIINAHSSETVKANTLDVRITHRFGDIAGGTGGYHRLYGFDNVADVRISFEYGITDDLTVALGRSKGAHRRELWDGFIKYRLLTQTKDNRIPVSVVVFLNEVITSAVRSSDSTSETWMPKFAHRISYTSELIIARKFNEFFSLQVMPVYSHRNFVASDDVNGIFGLGIGGRLKFTKRFGIIADYYYLLPHNRVVNSRTYYDPLSIGFEIETGGHVFHINFTNSEGILENEYLPYTKSLWSKGEFRFGFNISRVFTLFHK